MAKTFRSGKFLETSVEKGGEGSGRYPAGSGKARRLNAIFQSDKAHAADLTSKASLTSVLAQQNPENQIVIQNHTSLAQEYADMAELVKREMNETVGAPFLARSFATELYGALRNASKAHETASELGMEMLVAIAKDEDEHDGLLSEATQDLASDFMSASNYASDASNAVSLTYDSAPSYTEVSGEMFRNKARFTKGGEGSGRYPKGSGKVQFNGDEMTFTQPQTVNVRELLDNVCSNMSYWGSWFLGIKISDGENTGTVGFVDEDKILEKPNQDWSKITFKVQCDDPDKRDDGDHSAIKTANMDDIVRAYSLYNQGWTHLGTLDDTDAIGTDAFWQLVFYGDVVYG